MIATWTTYADTFLHVKQLFELRFIMLVSTGEILHVREILHNPLIEFVGEPKQKI